LASFSIEEFEEIRYNCQTNRLSYETLIVELNEVPRSRAAGHPILQKTFLPLDACLPVGRGEGRPFIPAEDLRGILEGAG
jgi:hypothetical protein